MDELLELLGRYDCHLKRDEKSISRKRNVSKSK